MDCANNPFGGSQQDHQDFLDRFRQGPQAVSEGETAARNQQVAPQLPPDVYQQSARDVFAQLTPEQRMQPGQLLGGGGAMGQATGAGVPAGGGNLSGSVGGMLSSTLTKGVLGGDFGGDFVA
jgi:hypothetical protein